MRDELAWSRAKDEMTRLNAVARDALDLSLHTRAVARTFLHHCRLKVDPLSDNKVMVGETEVAYCIRIGSFRNRAEPEESIEYKIAICPEEFGIRVFPYTGDCVGKVPEGFKDIKQMPYPVKVSELRTRLLAVAARVSKIVNDENVTQPLVDGLAAVLTTRIEDVAHGRK